MSTSWKAVRDLILADLDEKGAGATLDSDREYAMRARASVPTVKRAMAALARQGLVRRSRGRLTVALAPPSIVSGSALSFRRSAETVHGHSVVTKVLELTCRLPNSSEFKESERRAQEALGLSQDDSFYVISRRRILSGETRAIHRSYLNPALLPPTFLLDHDFEATSLLEILESCGFQMLSRETRIRASLPTDKEAHIFGIDGEPVLNVNQTLRALLATSDTPVEIEYLIATYCRWEYVIENRL